MAESDTMLNRHRQERDDDDAVSDQDANSN